MSLKLNSMIGYPCIIFLAFVSFQVLNACNSHTQKPDIEAIEVRYISPYMGENFYRIYYLDNLVMYENRYRFDSSVKQFRIDSTTQQLYSDDTLLLRQWRSQFFVFHLDSSYGYRYDPYGVHKNGRLGVDSELKRITGTNRFDSVLRVKPDTIVWNMDKSELKEVYVFPKKKDMPDGRVSFYYSKELNHLKNSFNRTVDSARKMKFFKVEFIFSEFYSEKDNILWPPTLDMTEMREISVENPEEIKNYFKRYKRSIKLP